MEAPGKILMDLEKLNTYNADGCAACNGKFNLGDTAVLACGFWEGGPRLVHEHEAVFDSKTGSWVERQCYTSRA